jgi:hypothetical protein
MADLTEQQLTDLNAELLPLNQAVRTEDRDGVTIYQLCKLTPTQEIMDITRLSEF